jgi:hypothetical protein
VRRTLPAMAVTWPGSSPSGGRVTYPPATLSPRTGRGDWVLQSDSGFVDAHGQLVPFSRMGQVCPADPATFEVPTGCLRGHGLQRMDLHHSDSHNWALQGAESAIFRTLAAVLLALTVAVTLRRLS